MKKTMREILAEVEVQDLVQVCESDGNPIYWAIKVNDGGGEIVGIGKDADGGDYIDDEAWISALKVLDDPIMDREVDACFFATNECWIELAA